jgi:hypothetical protein
VCLADIPPAVFGVGEDGEIDRDTWRKTIVDPETGHAVFYVRFGPNQSTGAHWHPSDTMYVVTSGTLIVEGEGTYGVGEVRLVQGGHAYLSEGAGPEGCEFYFVSLGPFGRYEPGESPASPGGPRSGPS